MSLGKTSWNFIITFVHCSVVMFTVYSGNNAKLISCLCVLLIRSALGKSKLKPQVFYDVTLCR